MDESQRQRIRQILVDCLCRRLSRIERLTLDDLDINPFLLRLLSHERAMTMLIDSRYVQMM